ncbi:hypothetical protein M0R45_035141 [Rubus argutus]|uniref:Haloacid dehalogenase-like hydrolase domain-containing protein Sgpp n=1 Tax=Rubus argutus TaxID=59490 RepID=A0AAW1VTS8_RUBAR
MVALPQLLHYHHHFPKTHLQTSTFHRQNLTKRGSASLTRTSISSDPHPLHRKCSLAFLAPLEAILFDIDGTLCDSDPLHYYAFREMIQEVGFNGGIPITEEFFIENISGMHNEELCGVLFPDWDLQRARKFFEDKEDMFRRLASERLEPMKGPT